MSLFAKQDVAIDLGTTRVRMLIKGRGLVLDEPVSELVDDAAFTDAGQRLTALCRAAFKRGLVRTGPFATVRVVASVPSSIDEVRKRVVEDALHAAGCKQVFLIESPMAAAIGAGEPVSEAKASAVVDIGATRIQVAFISLAGIVVVLESMPGPQTDASTLPGRIADVVRSALSRCLAKGCCNLVDDIARGGLVLTGGGALTSGLAEALKTELNLPIRQVDKPDLCVIEGAGVVLKELDFLSRTAKRAPREQEGLGFFVVFIIGAGFTGIALARTLIAEKNSVILIDNDAERVRHASDQLDCTVLEADGNDLEVLESAGISAADALVTLTEDDEINMITCSLVDAVYPKILKIARVRNYAYYDAAAAARRRMKAAQPQGRPLYGIDVMLNPDVEVADAINRAMEYGAVGSVVDLEDGFVLTTLRIGVESPLANRPVRLLGEVPGWRYIIACVETDTGPVLPNGNRVLRAGDRIGVVSRERDIPALAQLTRSEKAPTRRIVIFGADRLGCLIAERQIDGQERSLWSRLFGRRTAEWRELVIVDRDPDRCHAAARKFPDARVLCGDVTDEALLAEEKLAEADLLAAVSGNHELNLVTAAYLRSRGVKKAVALTANAAYGDIARKLGIDVSVPVRGTVVDGIMSHLRGSCVQAVHSVCDNRFVLVEGQLAEGARFAGLSLREAAAAGGFLVLLYRKEGDKLLQLPGGETVLAPHAHVVVIAEAGDLDTLRKFFR